MKPTCIKTSTRHGANRLTFDEKYAIISSLINKNSTRKIMIIETKRLFLREMTEEDFSVLYKVLADSNIM